MALEDTKQAQARAQVLERLRNKKAAASKPDTSAPVKAKALHTIQGHDEEGLPVEYSKDEIFNSTENELGRLKSIGAARKATDEEIAAAEELADEEEDPEPSETDEFAEGREIRNYHEYKHEARVEVDGQSSDVEESLPSDETDETDETETDDLPNINKMKKDDLIAELEQRGYEVDSASKVEDLKEALKTARAEGNA